MDMNNVDKQYLKFLNHILEYGEEKGDRTGTGTLSIFDYSMTFDMSEGFPLLTSKKVYTKAVIHELIWFLRGDTNIRYLVENGVHIWDGDAYKNYLTKISISSSGEWCKIVHGSDGNNYPVPYTQEEFVEEIINNDEFAKEWGELGPVYGKQWRAWGGYDKVPSGWYHNTVTDYKSVSKNDQITDLINRLKKEPDSRRLMVSAWNVGELDQMVLPPCHFGFQCYTSKMSLSERVKWWCDSLNKNTSYGDDATHEFLNQRGVPERKLSLKWFQRSVDSPLGLPFNIASYAILLHLLSKEVNMVPYQLKFNGGDCHIYLNQVNGVKQQLSRETFKLPKLKLHNSSIFDLKFEDIEIIEYDERIKTIKFPLSN
jgi:thymidylate synthase